MTKIHSYITRISTFEPRPEYEENRPVIPTEDKCCRDTCTMLHDTIFDLYNEYNSIESTVRRLPRAPRSTRGRQKEMLDHMKILQDMSYTLTEDNICKCVEKYPQKYPEGLAIWQG